MNKEYERHIMNIWNVVSTFYFIINLDQHSPYLVLRGWEGVLIKTGEGGGVRKLNLILHVIVLKHVIHEHVLI